MMFGIFQKELVEITYSDTNEKLEVELEANPADNKMEFTFSTTAITKVKLPLFD